MTPLCRLTTFIFFSKIGLFASKEQWANGTGVCPSYGLHTDYRRTRPLTTCSCNRAGSRRIVLPAQCRSWITKNTRFVIVLSIYFVHFFLFYQSILNKFVFCVCGCAVHSKLIFSRRYMSRLTRTTTEPSCLRSLWPFWTILRSTSQGEDWYLALDHFLEHLFQ